MKKQIQIVSFMLMGMFCLGQRATNPLEIKWQFRQKGTEKWIEENVIGNVHLDLYRHGLIPNHFFSDNEKKLQWIENEDWEYEGTFYLPLHQIGIPHTEISFTGLDTYATVYLNDSLIIQADNMFREWKKDVEHLLKFGDNKLYILFESPLKKAKAESKKLSYVLPEGERVFARKGQYHYGWDWGPRFVTSGICGPVYLENSKNMRFLDVSYRLNSLTKEEAQLDIIFKTKTDTGGVYYFTCGLRDTVNLSTTNLVRIKKHLKPGYNYDTIRYKISRPQWWWCNGLGAPNIYVLGCWVHHRVGLGIGKMLKVGLRKIELVTQKDKRGSTFYIKLNGVPVFIRGANYIPETNFIVPYQREESPKVPRLAQQAGINMLRVWGGGVYGSDEFYEQCDKMGILVWQDFMFACAMYPGDEHFIENVKQEIQDQTVRLRNHPCLALWCGNNENDEGWKNWGWQKQFNYSKADSTKIWNDYVRLFHKEIPEILKQTDPQRPYWPSSPSIGWGHQESMESGDSHYWGVWWGMEPFSMYQKKVGRFMSEYGFQSLPDLSEFKTFCPDSELHLGSASVKAHQKHKTGFETIDTYMKRDYKIPSDFRDYIYTSQLLQRDGMKTAIEAHRAAKPYCMGTMFWQFNDCWPVTSWSAYSYHGPKALYYSLQQLYAQNAVIIHKKDNGLQVSCITDSPKEQKLTLSLKLMDFYGKLLWKQEEKVSIQNERSQQITIPKTKLPAFDTTACVLVAELVSIKEKKNLASNHYFFTSPKHLNLPRAQISIVPLKDTLQVSSTVFAKDLYLYSGEKDLPLNINYFDLMPGEKKTIPLPGGIKAGAETIKYIVLNNIK